MGSETQLPALRQRAALGYATKSSALVAGVDSDVCSRSAGFQLVAAVAERSRALPTAGGALELALQGTSFTRRDREQSWHKSGCTSVIRESPPAKTIAVHCQSTQSLRSPVATQRASASLAMAAAPPERYSYVEFVGGADGTETCLLLCVGRCGSDALQNREACYAFRCGEGCARLLGANDVSLKHLRATFLNKAADVLGVPELFLHCRESGVDMPCIVGDARSKIRRGGRGRHGPMHQKPGAVPHKLGIGLH